MAEWITGRCAALVRLHILQEKEIRAEWMSDRTTGGHNERKLCAFPFIEVCGSDVITYMAPLSRQTDFFVPEMKEEVKADVKEEDSDEDRGTDITGVSACN
ncbi:Testis-expressed protein 264 [Takifugu flavidus]|uniref:Testis-expressed protein 264 n=1 Tax=Takifugu flavidus TaxID=433684 RepID=A0A5C6N3X1_9TELE|nr:Testis-expressed protein 264 [Takifugu flavidus]